MNGPLEGDGALLAADELIRMQEAYAQRSIVAMFQQARAVVAGKDSSVSEGFERLVENQSIAVVALLSGTTPRLELRLLAYSSNVILYELRGVPYTGLPPVIPEKDKVTAVVLARFNTQFSIGPQRLVQAQAIVETFGEGISVDRDQEVASGDELLELTRFLYRDSKITPRPHIFLLTNF